MTGLTPGRPASGAKGRIIKTGMGGDGSGGFSGGGVPVPPHLIDIVGYGEASFSDSCVITSLIHVPRSTPIVGRTIIVVFQAAGAVSAPFVKITDNAAPENYFHCIDANNVYVRFGPENGISLGMQNWDEQSWSACVLNQINIGDKITVQFGGVWEAIRAVAFAYEGLLSQDPLANPSQCLVHPDVSGGPNADASVVYKDITSGSALRPSTGHILPNTWEGVWDFPASLALIFYTSSVVLAPETVWGWDDTGITTRGGWYDQDPTWHMSLICGDQSLAGPVGPFVGHNIELGGSWDSAIGNGTFAFGQGIGAAAGSGPPLCSRGIIVADNFNETWPKPPVAA